MSDYTKKYQKYKLKYHDLKKKLKLLKGGSGYRFKNKFDSIDFNDLVCVAGYHERKIIACSYTSVKIFNFNGRLLDKFGELGQNDGQFSHISGITVLANGYIATCDIVHHVQIFNSNGVLQNKFGSQGTEEGQFNYPSGIAGLTNGDIAVCDRDNNRVQIFDSEGRFKKLFGFVGTENGQFNSPRGIAVLTNGNIGICDNNNYRVQIFNSDGIFLNKFGSPGSGDGEFYSLVGISGLPNGNIAVCDYSSSRVQIFDSNGNFQSKFGSEGTENGEFRYPTGIAVLANGDIVVCDEGNHSVKIFGLNEDVSGNYNIDNIDVDNIDNVDVDIDVDNIDIDNDDIDNDEITPINIQEVITNINFFPDVFAGVINIQYLEKGKEKIFDFDQPFNNSDNQNNLVKVHVKHNLFETLYQNRKQLLTPHSKPQFNFWNIVTGIKDDGVDAGGLSRTVFTYLSNSLFKTIFFIEDPETKLFRLKTLTDVELCKDENKDKLYFIGQLFGFAIILNLTIQIKLEPILLYQLTHVIDLSNINKELILSIINDYDNEILEHIPYMCFDINPSTLITPQIENRCLYDSEGDTIIDIGKIKKSGQKIIDINEIDMVKNATVNRIIEEIKETKKVTEIFVRGFRSQINIKKSKINRLPLDQLNNLISGIVAKDYATLFKHLEFVNFTPEQKTYLEEILKNQICINIQSKYIGLLLMVMTGSNTIPAGSNSNFNGFVYYPLRFEIRCLEAYKDIEIHSCFNHFIINKKIFNDYANAINTGINKKDTELYNLFNPNTLEKLKNEFSIR